MRALTKRGPMFIGWKLDLPASTVGKVLRRHHTPLLRETDPVTGLRIRASRSTGARYEHQAPGDLIHVDVKKLGRIPDGGGWRVNGREHRPRRSRSLGYDYVHTVIDDHSRIVYAEIHSDEKGVTAAGVLERAVAFYAGLGITVRRVISDNAFAYRHSAVFKDACARHGIEQRFIKPHSPWTNGKVGRLNRTLATEWAYVRAYASNEERSRALRPWIDNYNLERPHLGVGGLAPIERVTNGRSQYT